MPVNTMDYFWIIILGAVQGATEFLPVSSSGHLAVGQMLITSNSLKDALASQPLLLEILLHLATLAAVLVFYRKDLVSLFFCAKKAIAALFKRELAAIASRDDSVNMLVALIIGTIPTGIIGYFMQDVAAIVSQTPLYLGCSFMVCAGLLFASKFFGGGTRRLSWKMALIIGIIQGLAVLPGISRSGVTIALALALGLKREEAAKFSFLLSIPAILGAAAVKLDVQALASNQRLGAISLGVAAAFAVGLLALFALIKLVKAGRFWLFAPYVAAVGLATILIF